MPYLSYEYHNCQFKLLKSCHYLCENLTMVNVASDTRNCRNKTNKEGSKLVCCGHFKSCMKSSSQCLRAFQWSWVSILLQKTFYKNFYKSPQHSCEYGICMYVSLCACAYVFFMFFHLCNCTALFQESRFWMSGVFVFCDISCFFSSLLFNCC